MEYANEWYDLQAIMFLIICTHRSLYGCNGNIKQLSLNINETTDRIWWYILDIAE